MESLYATGHTNFPEKKCPLCGFNSTGGQYSYLVHFEPLQSAYEKLARCHQLLKCILPRDLCVLKCDNDEFFYKATGWKGGAWYGPDRCWLVRARMVGAWYGPEWLVPGTGWKCGAWYRPEAWFLVQGRMLVSGTGWKGGMGRWYNPAGIFEPVVDLRTNFQYQ